MDDDNSLCADEPEWMLYVGTALIVGTLASYGWQVRCILLRGNAKGVSFTAFLLNLIANVLLVVAYTPVFVDVRFCAHEYDFLSTTVKMMPAMQTMASSLMTVAVATLIVMYAEGWRKWTMLAALVVTIIGLTITWTTVCIVAVFIRIYKTAEVFAILSSVVAVIEWTPQLVLTLWARDLGALSPLMLLVQCVGEAGSLAFKMSMDLRHLSVFMWLPNVVNITVMVGILMVYIACPVAPPQPPEPDALVLAGQTEAEADAEL